MILLIVSAQCTIADVEPHLILHDLLLESWPDHGLFPRLLATRPDCRPVRSLHFPHSISILLRLLQYLVKATLAARWNSIGGRHWRRGCAVDWVVGWDGIVGHLKRPKGGKGSSAWPQHPSVGHCACNWQHAVAGTSAVGATVGVGEIRGCRQCTQVLIGRRRNWQLRLVPEASAMLPLDHEGQTRQLQGLPHLSS